MSSLGLKCRLCRSSGIKLFLKGDKCESPKCPVVRRQSLPGQHPRLRRKISDFGLHLKEKQKVKRIYLISETQLKHYLAKSLKSAGNTGEMLLSFLERRLDSVLLRGGLVSSRPQARQLIRHGHFKNNGRTVRIPSLLVKVGDRISFDKKITPREAILPSWSKFNGGGLILEIVGTPRREEITGEINEQLVVELYSR